MAKSTWSLKSRRVVHVRLFRQFWDIKSKFGFYTMLFSSCIVALDNGVGLTPFMGWNSWNKFGCNIDEVIVRAQVDRIVELGLYKAGYEYINIDDCWMDNGRKDGYMITDKERFPSGMKALGDYIHSKGLKFGIYSSAGTLTCQSREGSLYHEQRDAELFAYFGVDLLKYDNCHNKMLITRSQSIKRYSAMRDALQSQNRTVLYSLCQWGQSQPWLWADSIGNTFRSTADIGDLFKGFDLRCPCTTTRCWAFGHMCSVMNILNKQVPLTKYSKPGFFNDMDMLEVGNGGMTFAEYKSHFFLWAALKSPLVLGLDLRTIKTKDLDLLSSKHVIAVNQDPLGKSAELLHRTNEYDIWGGPLVDGAVAVLFNKSDKQLSITLDLLLLNNHLKCPGKVQITDLFTELARSVLKTYHTGPIVAHDSVIVKLVCD